MEELVMALCLLAEITAYAGFYRKILGCSKKKAALFTVILFALIMIYRALYAKYYDVRFVFRIMFYPIFICPVWLLFQGGREKKILAISILLFVERFVLDIFFSFFSMTELLFLHVIKKEVQPVLASDTVFGYVTIFITYVIGVMIIRRLSEYCVRIFEDKMSKWYIITSVPLFVLVILSDIIIMGAEQGIMVRSSGDWDLYYDQLFSYGGSFVFSLLAVLAAGFYVFGMHRIYLEQKKKECYQAQIMSYRMLEEQYRKMERVRHDFKNHVIALQGFLEKKEWENMKSYFRQLKIAADMEKGEEITGNTAIDALLSQKRKLAEENNISWECDMKITPEGPVDTYDLCVLLGNALDNAIEACERIPDGEARVLMMYAKTVKKCFLLEIRNSTDMRDIQKLEYSSKRNPEEHGLGFLNIKDVVQQYHGTMDVEIKENIFYLSILIPMPVAVSAAAYDSKLTV